MSNTETTIEIPIALISHHNCKVKSIARRVSILADVVEDYIDTDAAEQDIQNAPDVGSLIGMYRVLKEYWMFKGISASIESLELNVDDKFVTKPQQQTGKFEGFNHD